MLKMVAPMRSDPMEEQAFLRKVIDTYNAHHVDAFDALLTEECALSRDGVEVRGREAVVASENPICGGLLANQNMIAG
jgi:hypothetical protein